MFCEKWLHQMQFVEQYLGLSLWKCIKCPFVWIQNEDNQGG